MTEFSKVHQLLNEAQAERQKVLGNDSNQNIQKGCWWRKWTCRRNSSLTSGFIWFLKKRIFQPHHHSSSTMLNLKNFWMTCPTLTWKLNSELNKLPRNNIFSKIVEFCSESAKIFARRGNFSNLTWPQIEKLNITGDVNIDSILIRFELGSDIF